MLPPQLVGRIGIAGAMLALAGCSGGDRAETAEVSGTVTLDGTPLEEGTIVLMPKTGRSASGKIQDGQIMEVTTYQRGDGAVLGEHSIAIQPAVKEGPMTTLNPTDGPGGGNPGPGPSYMAADPKSKPKPKRQAIPPGAIPRRYRNPASSGLSKTINSGENQLTLELVTQ